VIDALKTNTIQTYTNVKQNSFLRMNYELKFKANEMKKNTWMEKAVIFLPSM
jgi:hypothetical protein